MLYGVALARIWNAWIRKVTLGYGARRVKYAINTETDERVAIKVLDKEKIQKQNMGAQIKKEISIMKMVRHKHVVVLREVLASRTKVR